jgi:hypothetical protein
LFPLFDGLEVDDLDKTVEAGTNGTDEANGVNGAKYDGIENVPLANGVTENH